METKYTFILPCLNEEKTLEYCIKEIQKYIKEKLQMIGRNIVLN